MNDSLCQFSLVSFNYFDWRVIKDYWFQSETSHKVQLKYGVSRNLQLSKDYQSKNLTKQTSLSKYETFSN